MLGLLSLARTYAQDGDSTAAPASPERKRSSILVIDGRTNEAIPDAEVLWARDPLSDMDASGEFAQSLQRSRRKSARSIAETLALVANGERGTTDAHGRVSLPDNFHELVCVARKDGLLGCSQWISFTPPDQFTLALWPDEPLIVHVQDADGLPVHNFGVELFTVASIGQLQIVLDRATTDEHGTASIPHARVTIAAASRSDSKPKQWIVAARGIGELASYAFEPHAVPSEAVTLRIAEFGFVELELLGADGQLFTNELEVVLEDQRDKQVNPTSVGFLDKTVPQAGRFSDSARHGRVVFGPVALGTKLVAFTRRNAVSRMNELRIDGPSKPGEKIQASFILGQDSVIFTGRALGIDNLPIATAELEAEVLNGPSPQRNRGPNLTPSEEFLRRSREKIFTDAEGGFCVEFDEHTAEEGPVNLLLRQRRERLPAVELRLELQNHWKPGKHELGDVHLTVPPTFVRGVVVDEQGKPLSGVQVGFDWGFRRSAHAITTDASGEFEFGSFVPAGRRPWLNVLNQNPFMGTSRSLFEPKLDLRITLFRPSQLVAKFTVPPGVNLDKLAVNLIRKAGDDGSQPYEQNGNRIGADGVVKLHLHEPGTYMLVVPRRRGTRRVEIDGIVVRPGETTDLGEIDLK